jgi:hypothetical protein
MFKSKMSVQLKNEKLKQEIEASIFIFPLFFLGYLNYSICDIKFASFKLVFEIRNCF